MGKRPIQLVIEEGLLDALDRLGQSQGLSRDSLIAEACRHYLAQVALASSEPSPDASPAQRELELLERQKEATEAQRNLLILQYERAIPDYPLRDPGALEWDVRRLERDIAQLRAQIAAKRLELLADADDG